jgi:sarcosine oxidase
MTADFEFAVVGGGGMGSAAAYYLAREGKSVLVLEQFEIGHNRGASHGENRIIRYSYEWTDYVKLAKEAYKLWAEAQDEFGSPLLIKTGGLDIGYPGNNDFDMCIDSLRKENIQFDLLDRKEASHRFPQFNIEAGVRCLYQKDAGYLEPDVCVPAFITLAKKHGATVKEGTVLDAITATADFVELKAGGESWRVKKLVLAPGPWAAPLLKQLCGIDIPIQVTLEQYAFFKPKHREMFDEKKSPVFIVYVTPGEFENLYGFPYFKELGVKVAEHRAGDITEAATRSMTADPNKIKRLIGRAHNLVPDLSDEILKSATCLYSNTPDKHFIIDKLPGHDNIVLAAGFSGHGFKFVPIVGNILKDLAVHGRTERPIDMFQLKRLAAVR